MKRSLLISFAFCSFAFAGEELDILNETKKDILKLKEKQIKEESSSNRLDIYDKLNLQGSINKNQDGITSEDYSISLSQEIFNFGGIKQQLKYAEILEKHDLLSLQIDNGNDLKELFELVIDTKINSLNIKQNLLELENSKIEVRNKRSAYEQGEVDISDLNNAIISKNRLNDNIKQLELNHLANLNGIKKFTSKDYSKIDIPDLDPVPKKVFLERSSDINLEQLNINLNKSLYEMKKRDYLPSLKLNGSYGISDGSDKVNEDYYNYGISVSMPLSLKSTSDIQSLKIKYLSSKKQLSDKLNELSLEYDTMMLKIKNFKERIDLASEDIELYSELLQLNKQEFEAGYKTADDVVTIENSKKIRELDLKIYYLNIKKIILVGQVLEIL